MAGLISRWKNRMRKKHMLDGPGMENIPKPSPDGQERLCIDCGGRIEPQHEHLVLCPQCGARQPEPDEE